MRLIDADPLEKEVGEMWEQQDGTEDGYNESLKAIHRAHTIDPVRHGHWITIKGSNGKDYDLCSVCAHTQEITGVKNYCAVCGAKMDEPVTDCHKPNEVSE